MPLLFVIDDLTGMSVDAIVSEPVTVSPTGKVCSSILSRASEKTRKKISRKLRFRKKENPILTKGYDFPARYIIHTFSPMWQCGIPEENQKLQNGYSRCLQLAEEKGCETVAFPLISNSDRPDSIETSFDAAVSAITAFLADHELTVYLVLSDRSAFAKALARSRRMQDFAGAADLETIPEGPFAHAPDHAGSIWHLVGAQEQDSVEEFLQMPEPHSSDTAGIPRPAAPLPPAPTPGGSVSGADSFETAEESKYDAGNVFQPDFLFEEDAPGSQFPSSAQHAEPKKPKFEEYAPRPQFPSSAQHAEPQKPKPVKPQASIHSSSFSTDDLLKDKNFTRTVFTLDDGFSDSLLHLIDQKGMTDVQCYKKANISRKLFSKIRSDAGYRPSKPTAVAFALALELTLPETQELLASAGYTLSRSFRFDRIIEFCINRKIYNVFLVNEVLFAFDQSLLGG